MTHFNKLKASRSALGIALIAVAVGSILVAQNWRVTPEGNADRPPNIIVYMVDTLRAQEIGVYGAKITKTPAIDAFAAESELFERAIAPARTLVVLVE